MLLLFYDDTCGFCSYWVQKLLKWDKKKRLYFAPLTGTTAKKKLGKRLEALQKEDTVIFMDNNGKIFLRARAIFRALWHIGGIFKILGLFSFLPTFPFDLVYRIIAKNRKHLGCTLIKKSLPEDKERFLS